MLRNYIFVMATLFALVFSGCSDGGDGSQTPTGNGTASSVTISGYAEDDPISNANVTLYDNSGNIIETVKTDENGLYSLDAALEKDAVYFIKMVGVLNDDNITMNSVFIFDENSTTVNINPLTEMVYQLHENNNSISLADRNKAVLSYFGIVESDSVVGTRFKMDSTVYKGMKKLAGSGIPLNVIEDFIKDIENSTTDLRAMVLDSIEIIPSVTSSEVNSSIEFTLNRTISKSYEVRWIGLEQDATDSSNQSLASLYSGDKTIAVKVYNKESLISEDSVKVNFYKVEAPHDIVVADNTIDTNVTIEDIKVSIPKGSLPAGVDKITVTNIDTGSADSLKTLKLEPSGTIFSSPVEIRIPYDLSTVIDPSTLFIERVEDDGSLEILKPTIDYKTQELIIKTDHFSTITIRKDVDDREYVSETYLDIEDDLFTTSGEFGIKLSSMSDTNFGSLVYDMTRKDILNDAAKARMTEFYNDGYHLKIDGFNSSYEKAFRYVLAEKANTKSVDMTKYEILVDSLKKFRLVELLERYRYSDMLKIPYKHLVYGSTTRSDFINEILRVESEEYGLNKGFKASSNIALENYNNLESAVQSINSGYLSVLENGFLATGSKFVVGGLWGYGIEYISGEVKSELGKHFTNKSLTHMQCFEVIDGAYWIGDDLQFALNDDGTVTDYNLGALDNIIDFASDMATDYGSVEALGGTLSNDQLNFMECVYRKNELLEEDTTLGGDFMSGGKAIASKMIRIEIHKSLENLYKMIREGNVQEYNTVLKVLNFNKTELEEYSDHLRAVAFANAEPIISSIMIEKKLIDGDTLKDMRVEDADFLSSPKMKKEAFVKFLKYYKSRDLRSTTAESSDKLQVYSLDEFKNFKLSIDEKYINDFSLDRLSLDINTIDLTKKASSGDIVESYYESASELRNFVLTASDVKKEDYTYNSVTKKYEITLGDLFSSIDVNNPAYLDIKLYINMTYKTKKLYLEKSIEFIADDTDDIVVEPVVRGGFKIIVTNETSSVLEGVLVEVGGMTCITDSTGSCTIQNLIPSEYEVSLLKEGYLPNYKNSFIDVGVTKELEFTLKEYDVAASLVLDVSAIRSEVNPLEYSFYISALGDDLTLEINYGDDTNTSGSITSLLSGGSYITHKYSISGVKNISVRITDSDGESLTKDLKAYPVNSDKVVEVVFLVDLSGSYGSSLANFKTQAIEIANGFTTLGSDVRVGLASFDEFPSYAGETDFAYREDYKLTYDFDAFNYSVDSLVLEWGGDGPESQLEGLYQVAETFNWNDSSEKYIFIATDASFHNSDVEPDYPGPGYKATLAALKAKGITVIGLNRGSSEIEDVTTITNDTSGTVFNLDSSSSDIVEKILDFAETREVLSRSLVRERVVGSTIQGNSN